MKVIDARLLDEIVRRIVAARQPEAIYLYGSHAYGQPHKDSDVDLPIMVRELARSPRESAIEVYRALRGLSVPVEVKVVTQREFERCARWLNSGERVVKEKGKVLYASPVG
jgi:predicted nucleotidyltransferase